MTTFVEQWPFARGEEKGMSVEQAAAFYGKRLSPIEDADDPVFESGKRALRTLRAQTRQRYGLGQAALLDGASPPLRLLFAHDIITERAVLLRRDSGGVQTYFPIAHIGPNGARLLTLVEATEAMGGKWKDFPPAGGFAQPGLMGFAAAFGRGVDNTLAHPAVRTGLTVGAVVALGRTLLGG